MGIFYGKRFVVRSITNHNPTPISMQQRTSKFCSLLLSIICFKQHFDTRYLVFYNPSPPRMYLSLDLLSEYRIQHGATFWKLIFKHQLGCGFDTLDSISSFCCILTYAIICVLIHHKIFGFIFTSLIFFIFFKYSCTDILHRRSLCTFYYFILYFHNFQFLIMDLGLQIENRQMVLGFRQKMTGHQKCTENIHKPL